MDWDKCNFKRINQRRTELKRWVNRDEDGPAKSPRKGNKHTQAKRKRAKK
jgi:hypothetical protein